MLLLEKEKYVEDVVPQTAVRIASDVNKMPVTNCHWKRIKIKGQQ